MLQVRYAKPERILCILLIVAFFVSGCVATRSVNPISGNKRFYGYTWQQELQIGKEADESIIAQYGLYNDLDVARYVDRLGQEILQYSHLRRPEAEPEFRNTKFTFRVLDSPVVNAFALPGGYVYITRGLLAHIENEAQLAVVLGHEIGHVAGRHASKRAASQAFGQLGLLGAAIGGQVFLGGNTAQDVLNIGGTAASLLFLSYGRDDERESDDVGFEYAALAGYKAVEAAGFFGTLRRMSEQHDSGIPSFLSTHPDPGEREQTMQQYAAKWAQTTKMTTVNQSAFYEVLDGIVIGDDPRNGFEQNSIFYHPTLRFQFPVPSGFQVINQASQVAMVEQNQQAFILFSLDHKSATAREASNTFSAQEGMTIIQKGQGSANGLPAHYVVAETQTQDGQTVRLRTYFVDYEGQVYTFLGYAEKSAYTNYEPGFIRTMQGFASLTDKNILNVQPTRLRITPASKTASFNTFLPSQLPTSFTAEGMAILNQLGLGDQVSRGTQLKLFQ